MNLQFFLDMVQGDGGATTSSGNAFGMDSFPEVPKKKKKSIIRTVYPEMLLIFQEKRAMIDLDKTIHKYSKDYKLETSREVQPELRQLRFKLDNYTCKICNVHKDKLKVGLHCHHLASRTVRRSAYAP